MGNVVGLRGPTVGDIIDKLVEAHAAGNISHIMVATLDAELFMSFGISPMTNERSVWMADHMLQKAREEQA